MLRDGVVSEPSLPADGSIDGVTLGQPFTTRAVVHITTSRTPDHSIMQAAQSPWRVVALPWNEKTRTGQVKDSGVVFIGLSLSDQIDTANTLTRFCAMVGIAVVLIGAILGTILVQSTLAPLKRIEKTAAKIAAGDLSQRVPDLPESTEVGSLSMSLNTMLTRIEESFHAQEETNRKNEAVRLGRQSRIAYAARRHSTGTPSCTNAARHAWGLWRGLTNPSNISRRPARV